MHQSSLLKFISAGILAASVSVIPMNLPASAQTTTGTGTQGTSTTGTTTTYDNYDNRGLWGLVGLVGLLGLVKRRKEDTHTTTTRREDPTVYRDPSIR